MSKPRNAYCSFCRKSHTDVGPLVEGPGEVYICGDCIELCQEIVRQEKRRRHPTKALDAIALREKLDVLVSGQEEAKQAFAEILEPREQRVLILLAGPSLAARVLLARALAHILEVPFARGDVSDLLPGKENAAGLPPLLFSLLQESNFDLDLAHRGVAYVEGAESPACQAALLEFCDTETFEPHGRIPFDPADIFLVCGANLSGCEPVRKALEQSGAVPEWLERLSAIAHVDPYEEAELAQMAMGVDFARLLDFSASRGEEQT